MPAHGHPVTTFWDMTLDGTSQIFSNPTIGNFPRFLRRGGYKRPIGVLIEVFSRIGEHPPTSTGEDAARERLSSRTRSGRVHGSDVHSTTNGLRICHVYQAAAVPSIT